MENKHVVNRRQFVALGALTAAAGAAMAGCSGGGASSAASAAASDASASAASADAASASAEAAASASGPAVPTDVKTVKLAAQSTSGQVFQFLAKEHGYLEEEGVDVELVYINNNADAYTALNSDGVNVLSTYGTGGPLIQIDGGMDLRIFGGYMITGETPCFGKPETEWKDMNSFVGKKVGVTRFSTADTVLKGDLYDAGILDKVEFVEYKKNQEVLQAIAKGEIDFGTTATGYELQAADLGLEVKMWPDDYWPNHSCCRMVAKTGWFEDPENQEALYRLLRAYIRAEEYMKDGAGHYDEVVDLVVKELDLDKPTVESFVKSPHMNYNTDPNRHAVEKMFEKMHAFDYLTNDSINIDDYINSDVYEKAITSLIDDYPDSKWLKDKYEEFKENNF